MFIEEVTRRDLTSLFIEEVTRWDLTSLFIEEVTRRDLTSLFSSAYETWLGLSQSDAYKYDASNQFVFKK